MEKITQKLTLITATLLTSSLMLAACQPVAAPIAVAPAATVAPVLPVATEVPAAAVPVIPTIKIAGLDYSYDAPAEVPAGLVTIDWENLGKEVHHAQLARLNDGVTMEQLQAAFKEGESAAFRLLEFYGGPGAAGPGGKGSVTLDLPPGQYIVVCFIPSPSDGVPHLAKGMLKPLTVTGTAAATPATLKADVEIPMMDFHFMMPAEVKAGPQVWKIVNQGPQPHELNIIKLGAGKTMSDVAQFMAAPAGPSPFRAVGGMQGLANGKSGYLNLDLAAGNYVAICNIPDRATGKSHAELGMVHPFTVQ